MYEFILKAHSGWAYLVLLILFVVVINSLLGMFSKRDFKPGDRSLALFGLIATHLQLVFGLLLYFTSPKGKDSLGIMDNAALRLTSLEHPLINIIAIILITLGWIRHKKMHGTEKFKPLAVLYSIGLVLILIRIPYGSWPF